MLVHRQIQEYLDQLNLGQIQKKQISALSGGEQQRVAIIRAIVSKPQIILCDEPTASLDSQNVHIFMEALLKLQRESRSTIIIVTHDQRVYDYGDKTIQIMDGRAEVRNEICLQTSVRRRTDACKYMILPREISSYIPQV